MRDPQRSAFRRRRFAALAFALACIVVGFVLGESYIGRLPNHAGYFLVAVDDAVANPPPALRPRHTVFIVVDGLRRDAAETMRVTRVLGDAGQCRVSDQGTYTVSRPEYALLSTGLEVDRSGARNNDLTSPLTGESIWQVAREAGLSVSGSSHLPWFRQLFPGGFDRFSLPKSHADDVFRKPSEGADLFDVNLFHPLYVDEAAHQHGAASPEYRAAVARADGEIAGLLERIDLTQDLVILTADHGHRDAGGHGGAQPEIRNVLVCFAGPHVARRVDRAPFDGRSTAPTLAVLLGLRFPRHMRAGEDGLDAIWEVIKEEDALGAYVKDRRAAVDRFRAANQLGLERWLGGTPGTWSRLYEREAGMQDRRTVLAGLVTLLGLVVVLRGRRTSLRDGLMTTAWMVFVALCTWGIHRLVLGELDYTVINLRERFVPRAALIGLLAAAAALLSHRVLLRTERLVGDYLVVLGLLVMANVEHVYIYGWPLGFPLPPAPARYLPFFGAIALLCFGLVAIPAILVAGRRP